MGEKAESEILHDHNKDGIDRRGFLKWPGWTFSHTAETGDSLTTRRWGSSCRRRCGVAHGNEGAVM